jgi:hypothetical protein
MQILDVPVSLQSSARPYPPHSKGVGIEAFFHRYALHHEIKTDWIYVPVYWTNNYHHDSTHRRTSQLSAMSAHQRILDSLNPVHRYFTLVQGDDGIYENTPECLTVFGAGGSGDIPIPLICDTQHPSLSLPRMLLASFRGTKECGGPDTSAPGSSSSWNVNGEGACVRRGMWKHLGKHRDIALEDSLGGLPDVDRFRRLVASSDFSLCPRGYGKTSFRLYESMEFNTIPVYICQESSFWIPWENQLPWHDFCVFATPEELTGLYGRLQSLRGSWLDNARAILPGIYKSNFTADATCQQIKEWLETSS